MVLGPWISDPEVIYGGSIAQSSGALLPGYSTIDPNIGSTSYTLGMLAVRQLSHFQLPTWNYYEGLGQPLLGGVIAAALFPPTLLLAIPGGQILEHAALQIVGGLGMFALLKLLRFRVQTCFLAGVAFEFCALFVWLKNAMINPIPFLVWVLVYGLRLIKGHPERVWLADALGLGMVAGCAVLAGFPETVLIFTVFLIAAFAFYAWQADIQMRSFAGLGLRFAVSVGFAFAVSGSALVALLSFAPVANFGSHLEVAFSQAHLSLHAVLKYLLPYISGPIFGFDIQDEIGSIGGYTGIILPALALLGLCSPGRLSERIFWSCVAFVCLATSHGFAPVQRVIMAIPGVSVTAFYRQANIVWLIALFFLAAHAVDQLHAIRRGRMLGVALCGLASLAILSYVDWDWIQILKASNEVRPWLVGSLVAAAAFLFVLAWTVLGRSARFALSTLIVEAAVMFFIPVLSLPMYAKKDQPLIRFLQQNTGLGRVVNLGSNILQPNFGSILDIKQLNFDSNPVPLSTTSFIKHNLDPMYLNEIPIYIQNFPAIDDPSRTKYMLSHISEYGAAGVRYVLTPPHFLDLHASFERQTNVPLPIADGESVSFKVRLPDLTEGGSKTEVRRTGDLSIVAATYNGTSDGDLEITVCPSDDPCRRERISNESLVDNGPLTLAHDLVVTNGQSLNITLRKIGGKVPLVLWIYKRIAADSRSIDVTDLLTNNNQITDHVPDISFTGHGTKGLTHVFGDMMADVYEVEAVRAYMSAQDCDVEASTSDRAVVDCVADSFLDRLEVWVPGWSARVDGQVRTVDEQSPFQRVKIDAGHHTVRFVYDPYHLRFFCCSHWSPL